MSDWLDSDDFDGFCWNPKLTGDLWLQFKAKLRQEIRSHFVPKPVWTKITEDRGSWPSKSGLYLVTAPIDYWFPQAFHIWQFTTNSDCGVEPGLCAGGYWYDFHDTDCGAPIAWIPLPEPYCSDKNKGIDGSN